MNTIEIYYRSKWLEHFEVMPGARIPKLGCQYVQKSRRWNRRRQKNPERISVPLSCCLTRDGKGVNDRYVQTARYWEIGGQDVVPRFSLTPFHMSFPQSSVQLEDKWPSIRYLKILNIPKNNFTLWSWQSSCSKLPSSLWWRFSNILQTVSCGVST
jgi:hypothetical protein